MKVFIYTDGACSCNPGVGGYGTILVCGDLRKELSQGYKLTTNNRMELLAVIAGLEALKKDNLELEIISDSKYVIDSVNKGWVFNWEKNNFKNRKNSDLWKRFLVLYRKHKVKMVWIKGHNSHPENEKCDKLAVNAYKQINLLKDEGYEIYLNEK
ncbi:MAG: ribonuclease HI [Ignavibacteria bacterium]|nr:ribonuclease HI [Ignavibacteria bacterium]